MFFLHWERRELRNVLLHHMLPELLSSEQVFPGKEAKGTPNVGQENRILFDQEDTLCHEALCFNIKLQF